MASTSGTRKTSRRPAQTRLLGHDDSWWEGETAIVLGAVPAELPPRADGTRRSVSSVYRWTQPAGVNGVRLRRFRVGGRGWATTREELARFLRALTAIAGGDV